jgi:hypothetical protein
LGKTQLPASTQAQRLSQKGAMNCLTVNACGGPCGRHFDVVQAKKRARAGPFLLRAT